MGLKRVFTCSYCKSFLTAIPGHRLNEGTFYTIAYSDRNKYFETLYNMNKTSTTVGRQDL